MGNCTAAPKTDRKGSVTTPLLKDVSLDSATADRHPSSEVIVPPVDLMDEPVESSKYPSGIRREFSIPDETKKESAVRKAGRKIKDMIRDDCSKSGDVVNRKEIDSTVGVSLTEEDEYKLSVIRQNLPPDVEIRTPFGRRKICYADYTASGRPLAFIEEYISTVVGPMFANTHTESSATGLQTTHFREEARALIKKSLGANDAMHSLIFHGSGTTGAINKFINMLDIAVPHHIRELYLKNTKEEDRPLVMVTDAEHHSNELMWRENLAQVIVIPHDAQGSVSVEHITAVLEKEKIRAAAKLVEYENEWRNRWKAENQDKCLSGESPPTPPTPKKRLVIGSFTAGSNVTGLRTNPYPVAALLHSYGALSCWDYAAAGPYVDINMVGDPNIEESHLDAIFLSPHKFVGGPGTPGILLCRNDCFDIHQSMPPTIAGGGTVLMVWPDGGVIYEKQLDHREEAGTPDIMGSIRAGLAFHVRDLIGPKLIEELEGDFARRAVMRLKAHNNIWIMGDDKANITSAHDRLSITSFNIYFNPPNPEENPAQVTAHDADLNKKLLHPHFIAAVLNDLYGLQARSGCSCAGPLGMNLFEPFQPTGFEGIVVKNAKKGFHAHKPGWCRVNFNYFIREEEFQFIIKAIEQVAEHGWKLLPLYALCLKTGQYFFNNRFDRFDGVRQIKEVGFTHNSRGVEWVQNEPSDLTYDEILTEAQGVFETAPDRVREVLFRFRDLRRSDTVFPHDLEQYRFFVLGSELLPFLGITKEEMAAANLDVRAQDPVENPKVVAFPKHPSANPLFTFGRPRG